MDWHGQGTASANPRMQTFISPEAQITCKGFAVMGEKGFTRMYNLFNRDAYAVVFCADEKHFRVSESEAPQFQNLAELVKRKFLEEYRAVVPSENLFSVGFAPEDGMQRVIMLYRNGVRVGAGSTGQGLPSVFKDAPAGGHVLTHVFVDYEANKLVIHTQWVSSPEGTTAASRAAINFAGFNGCSIPLQKCSGCAEVLGIMKKCSVCMAPFCDAECLKQNWKQHKLVCSKLTAPAEPRLRLGLLRDGAGCEKNGLLAFANETVERPTSDAALSGAKPPRVTPPAS